MSSIYPIPENLVRGVRECLAVIRTLYTSTYTMDVSAVARATGIEYSLTEKLLYTLEVEGIVEQDKPDQWTIHNDVIEALYQEYGR